MIVFYTLLTILFLSAAPCGAQYGFTEAGEEQVAPAAHDTPTFVSLQPNINDFGRFADSGPDSNWYIGFDNAWVVKLPPAPDGPFVRAFIGARLGRAKAMPAKPGSWERVPIPGKVYMAISQRPAFSSQQSFFLAETADIPLEPDDENYLKGTGRSEWFWAEVPLRAVSFTQPNYLIIWSPTREFKDASRSPILAAGKSRGNGSAPFAWNNGSLQGVPPRGEEGTLQVPINIVPGMAIKLVPEPGGDLTVSDFELLSSGGDALLARLSAEGKNVELAWVEMSYDAFEWRRVTPYQRTPPYAFTLPRSLVPARGAHFRGKARDILAVEGHSETVFVDGRGAR